MDRTLLRCPLAVVAGRAVDDAAVLCEDGRIVAAGPRTEIDGRDATIVDVDGTLLPGLVDIQVNGMGGRGCEEDTPGALDVIARTAWAGGAAAFLPTVITAPLDLLCERVVRIAAWIDGGGAGADAATPLGIHVEGPFLELPGAHDASHLLDPSPERIERVIEAGRGHVRLVTLAPGRTGAAAATARLRENGIAVSLGHAKSTEHFADCVEAGARGVTHLFNVMSGLHHREPGIVGFALDDQRLWCGLIVDGIHIHPAVVRTACRALGPDRTILVTDAADAAGMPDGSYALSGMEVTLKDGVVRDREGRLAGSALTMAQACACYLRFVPGADVTALARVAAANPARLIGEDAFGEIRPGAVARFAVLADDRTMRALRA